MWDTILFDLDGTLTDSQEGITNSLRYALDRFGITLPKEELLRFIGPPLTETFPEVCGFDREQTEEAIRLFRLYFEERGWAENAPYPGIRELLEELKAAGAKLLVATSKPRRQAVRVLEHFGLAGYFEGIFGPSEGDRGTRKGQVIRQALESVPGAKAVMVGDRSHDAVGAKENGLACVGVLYGYGSREELETAGARAVAGTVEELKQILLAGQEAGGREDTDREDPEQDEKRRMNKMEKIATLIAKDLLSIKAVFLRPEEPFTWASGIKSPVYCDNRLTLTAPAVRSDVENSLAETIRREFPEVEVLMGTSTAGIAHAAITGHIMGLPMGYVRSGSKDHGRQNQIEGRLEPGQKVVVVEDLISTGGSVIEVVNALREAGAEVLGIVSIFTYGMQKGLDRLAAANVRNVSLSNFDTLVQVAAEEGYIKSEDVSRLIAFRNNPSDESWISGGAK